MTLGNIRERGVRGLDALRFRALDSGLTFDRVLLRLTVIGRSEMSRTAALVALLCLLSALNLFALVINNSRLSRAAVGGMKYEDLMRDPDFTRAVKSIAQECGVNVDIAKLIC